MVRFHCRPDRQETRSGAMPRLRGQRWGLPRTTNPAQGSDLETAVSRWKYNLIDARKTLKIFCASANGEIIKPKGGVTFKNSN
jgi:hypothetical protein